MYGSAPRDGWNPLANSSFDITPSLFVSIRPNASPAAKLRDGAAYTADGDGTVAGDVFVADGSTVARAADVG